METGALHVLRRATGEDVEVVGVDQLATARGTVERWRLDRDLHGVGRSVVVKRRDTDSEIAQLSHVNLRTEQLALELITRRGADIAPRCIAGGADDGVLVLTDVGALTVESTLFGNDERAAVDALAALGHAVARLHATPLDRDRFDGVDTWTVASRDAGWRDVRAAVAALGLPEPSGAADVEVAALMDVLRSPGDDLALVHGDLTPSNVVVGDDGRARLIDFEGAGFQHIGLDLAMLRFPFVWYGRWAEMPTSARAAMEDAYRTAAGAVAADLHGPLAIGCMAMCLLRLERLPRIADEGQPSELASRRRSQIVATVGVAIDVASGVERFAALTSWLEGLRAAMQDRWTETRTVSPAYPVFQRDS